MGEEELTEADRRLFEYIKGRDFESRPWSTPEAARALGMEERAVYESLSNLSKHMKGRFYIYYKNGALRVQAE
ncbi:MAG: hypothetical protein ACUVV6_05625 [Thermoplasmatota archaeon]